MKRAIPFAAALAMVVAAPAFAEVPMAERGIVQEEMTGEAGFAFNLDMSAGRSVGDVMRLPIWVEYSFLDNLELGFRFPLQLKPSGNIYTGFDFWGLYRFLNDETMELGAGLVIHFPKDRIEKALGFSVVVPFRYQIMDRFSLSAALELNLGPIVEIFDPAVITLSTQGVYNITPGLYAFLGVGLILPTMSTDDLIQVPMTVGVGCTIIGMIDVGVQFDAVAYQKEFVGIHGGPFDTRSLSIFTAFSF